HRGSTQPPGFAARGTGRLAGRSAGSTDRPCPGAVARRPGATLDHRGTGSRGRPVPLGVRRALPPPARPAAHALPVPVATATGRPPAARGAHAGEHRGGGRLRLGGGPEPRLPPSLRCAARHLAAPAHRPSTATLKVTSHRTGPHGAIRLAARP